LDDIPVFAKAGAIIPLMRQSNEDDTESQDLFEIHLFPSANGSFDLFTGDEPRSTSVTALSQNWGDQEWLVQIDPLSETDSLPETRTYEIWFRGVHPNGAVTAESDGRMINVSFDYDIDSKSVRLAPITIDCQETLTITLTAIDKSLLAKEDRKTRTGHKMLRAFRMNSHAKQRLASELSDIQDDPTLLAAYQLSLTGGQFQALAELMTGSGFHCSDKRDGPGEEIILWNNQLIDLVRQIFAAEELDGLVYSSKGPLPKFAVFSIEKDMVSQHIGIQPAKGVITVQSWFAILCNRISREQVGDVDAVIQFDITGPRGCKNYLVISQGDLSLHEGSHVQPSVTITTEADAWLALINGEQSAEEMFLGGILGVRGNLELMVGLIDIIRLSSPGKFRRDKWRLDVNYLDALTLQLGEKK